MQLGAEAAWQVDTTEAVPCLRSLHLELSRAATAAACAPPRRLISPDETVVFEFKHNVCGRQIYAEGTVDAALFLAAKVAQGGPPRVYDMVDVLREGAMR